MTWLSRFTESISSLAGISIGKWFAVKEITPSASIPEVVVFQSELQFPQALCHKKLGIARFSETPRSSKSDIGKVVNQVVKSDKCEPNF